MTRTRLHILLGYIGPEFLLLNFCMFITLFFQNSKILYFPLYVGVTSSDFVKLFFTFNLVWASIVALNGKQDFYLVYGFAKRFRYIFMNVLVFIGGASTLSFLDKV